MNEHEVTQDFGTGRKTLGIYVFGLILCSVLTVISFWTVMSGSFSKIPALIILFGAALVQFFVQLICFLRLNVQTDQSRINVMTILFTGVILVSIVGGSLWIMWSLNYYMSH